MAAHRLSLGAVSGGWALLFVAVLGFSPQRLLWSRSTGSGVRVSNDCKQAQGLRLWTLDHKAQQRWHSGLDAPWQVGPSWTRD